MVLLRSPSILSSIPLEELLYARVREVTMPELEKSQCQSKRSHNARIREVTMP
jgi:hypothetical protein